jgi:Tfp pilus assembly PilM family ATPase
MLQFLKDRTCSAVPILRNIAGLCPIGVGMSDDALTMAQLADNGRGITLVAGEYKSLPPDIKAGSVDWQRWAIDTVRQTNSRGLFRGRDVVAAISPAELFIDHIKMPAVSEKSRTKDSVDKAVILKIKQRLPFDPANALIKYIPAEEDHAVVIAAERKIIDRHLALYEKAGLTI